MSEWIRFERLWVLGLSLVLLPLLYWLLRHHSSRQRPTAYLKIWEEALAQSSFWERWLAQFPRFTWLLTLLCCVALILAAAGTQYKKAGGGVYHLLVDSSASMSAVNDKKMSRRELSQLAVKKFLEQRLDGDRVSLSSVQESVRPVVAQTLDYDRAAQALQQIPSPLGESDFRFIEQLKANSGEYFLLFTDGVGNNVESLRTNGSTLVYGVASPVENSGIVGVEVQDSWPRATVKLTVSVQNFSQVGISRILQVSLGEKVVQTVSVSIEPGQLLTQQVQIDRGEGGVLNLRLDPPDAYSLDDEAGAIVLPPLRSKLVLLKNSAQASPFLRAMAEVLEKEGQNVTTVEKLEGLDPDSIALIDGGNLSSLENADGKYLLFGTQVPSLLDAPARKSPKLLDWSHDSPLFRDLGWEFLNCRRALSVTAEVEPLVRATDGDLVFSKEFDRARVIATAFELKDSNFPVQSSFPLFVKRSIAWLSRQSLFVPPAVRAGRPAFLSPEFPDWMVPSSLGPLKTPVGNSYSNFFSVMESAQHSTLKSGWSQAVPEGPGIWKDAAPWLLLGAATCLALRLLLERLVR